ncbi:MAG: GNAT family N-acetyltransferase [Bacteroidetes bacterium]|nr:GNAT family N-acetyltransferase [Bacteroidota bacterium]
MQIITNNNSSTKQIVDLLKLSLGENSTQKTVEFWDWKHHQNPFGESQIICAFEQDNLIGVRAFMKWQFANNNQTILCERAVDTAVHPKFQGKGIFTKLTLQALDQSKLNGIDLIYNTPNTVSKKGYLKMGWIENGRLPLKLSFHFGIPSRFKNDENEAIYSAYKLPQEFKIEEISTKIESSYFETVIDKKYIIWRYLNCPINKYGYLYDENNYLVVFRLKEIKGMIELRLCDIIILNNKKVIDQVINEMKILIRKIKPVFISCCNTSNIPKLFFKKLFFNGTIQVGPQITLRSICDNNSIHQFKNFKHWQPSLGCMELF